MKTVAYLLVSHDCRLLPMQVAAIHKFMPDVTRIVVVMDEHGVRLADGEAERMGVEVVLLNYDFGNLAGSTRSYFIEEMIWDSHACGQAEPLAMMLHGDCLPMAPMIPAALLDGWWMAGRSYPVAPGRWRFASTWVIADVAKVGPGVKFSRIDFPEHEIDGRAFKRYGQRRATDDIPELPEVQQWEWCEPGWLHVDKLSLSSHPGIASTWYDLKIAKTASLLAARGLAGPWKCRCLPPPAERARPAEPIPPQYAPATYSTEPVGDCGCGE